MKQSKSFLTILLGLLFALPTLSFSQEVVTFFTAPGAEGTWGLTWDGEHLWSASVVTSDNAIYELDTSGNVLSSFHWDKDIVSGMAWDGAYLWLCENFTGNLYQVTQSGELIRQMSTSLGDVAGLTWDGSNLWVIDRVSQTINKLDSVGQVLASFPVPILGGNADGLTWDGSSFWFCDPYYNKIFQLTSTGTVLQEFSGPGLGATELEWDGKYLWVSDIVTDRIYKLKVASVPPQPVLLYSWQAKSIDGALAPPPYGLRLDNFFKDCGTTANHKEEVTFGFDSVCFDEFDDGTAHLYGRISVAEWNNCGGPGNYASDWGLDVWFQAVTAPEGSDPSWRFYKINPDPQPNHPEMVNWTDSADYVQLWSYPSDLSKPFQVGIGANEKNNHFGASGSLNYLRVTPSCTTGGGPDNHIYYSSFLMDLVPKIPSDQVVSAKVKFQPKKWALAWQDGGSYSANYSLTEMGEACLESDPLVEGVDYTVGTDGSLCFKVIRCYIGNLQLDTLTFSVRDILVETIRMNDTLGILKKEDCNDMALQTEAEEQSLHDSTCFDVRIFYHFDCFEGEVLRVKFDAREAFKTLGPVEAGDTVEVCVTGRLKNGLKFSGCAKVIIIGDHPTAVNPQDGVKPRQFALLGNYPNPFNASTMIQFSLTRASQVELTVYNILGQKVRSLVSQQMNAGFKQVVWEGRDEAGNPVSSGIYFYQLRSIEGRQTGKMTMLK